MNPNIPPLRFGLAILVALVATGTSACGQVTRNDSAVGDAAEVSTDQGSTPGDAAEASSAFGCRFEGGPLSLELCSFRPFTCMPADHGCAERAYNTCILPADGFPDGSVAHIYCNDWCVQATSCRPPIVFTEPTNPAQCQCGDGPACINNDYCVSTPENPAPHCECFTHYRSTAHP